MLLPWSKDLLKVNPRFSEVHFGKIRFKIGRVFLILVGPLINLGFLELSLSVYDVNCSLDTNEDQLLDPKYHGKLST